MGVSRDDWVSASLEAMRQGGIDAVAIEPLAQRLGVTKGSFYWHFRSRRDLWEALLVRWEHETEDLIISAKKAGRPRERVLRFFEGVAAKDGQIPDTEFFAWARHDKAIAKRALKVEARRVGFILDQLRSAGIGSSDAAWRAEAGYLATLGWIERAARETKRHPRENFSEFTKSLICWLFESIPLDRSRRTRRVASVSRYA